MNHSTDGAALDLVVIGCGYVGLPLLVEASRAGLRCAGLEANPIVVDALMSGRSHIDDISDDDVRGCVDRGSVFTTDPGLLGSTAAVVICVPTPLNDDRSPDLRYVLQATVDIRDHLSAGQLVVLESTTYPGTTDGVVRKLLEESGLRAGVDFNLAFSPERIDPGNPTYGLRNTPKVVGGFTPSCTERASRLYGEFVDEVVPVAGTREAEMAKLLENTYRHVNIALVNEMAIFSHDLGIDLWEVIRAASTKPFGFAAFRPGPGVGGHCIPIDPNYLSFSVRELGYQFRFVELAQEISNRMPAYVAARVQNVLNAAGKPVNGSQILLLGLSYKADISDERETPARPLIRALRRLGAVITAHDPFVNAFEVDGVPVEMSKSLESDLAESDLVVLLQAHSTYDLDDVARRAASVFDTRGLMRHPNVERL